MPPSVSITALHSALYLSKDHTQVPAFADRMNIFSLIVAAAVVAADAANLDHDRVQPFPQPVPVTSSEKAALKFKPQLHITNGCHPYPAVNAAGDTSGGLKKTGAPSGSCEGSGYGSQVYGRAKRHNGVWAIMFAWYFPKDSPSTGLGHRHDWENVVVWISNPDVENPEIMGVSPSAHGDYSKYAPPSTETINGTSAKINYESHWPINHATDSTSESGEFQDLIMWDQLPDAARVALQNTDFGDAHVPMKDGSFESNLDKAWPFQ